MDDEPLNNSMLQNSHEESISNTSISQYPSNLQSLNLEGQDGATLSTDSPFHILGISASILDPSASDSSHTDQIFLARFQQHLENSLYHLALYKYPSVKLILIELLLWLWMLEQQ